ncbi:MAG: arsenic resistance N-acetyltransferase ArsN2 [Thermoleophilia bacterium]
MTSDVAVSPLEPVLAAAEGSDLADVIDLLAANDLPTEDVASHLDPFVVARLDGRLVGVVGLEVYGGAALGRSLCVHPAERGRGLGRHLFEAVMDRAREICARELYLLTTTAEDYFSRLGFEVVERETVPAEIRATMEFASLCPATAVCMRVSLARDEPQP